MTSHARQLAMLCAWFGLTLLALGAPGALAERLSPSRATMPGSAVSLNDRTIDLTLSDAVFLGLRDNRAIRSAYLERIAQKFDLRVEEERFMPKLALSARHLATRSPDEGYRQTEVIPQATLLGAYGTRFSLAWTQQITQANRAGYARSDGASLSVVQPLLRGAGREVATAAVRLARLSEQAHRLTLRASVSDTITQIIAAHRDLVRAQEQVRIARDALERSQQLLAANKAMIAAGRMADFEVVQTEADAATQELAVEEAANGLEASRLDFLRLLALGLQTRVQAVDSVRTSRVEVHLDQALAIALEQHPGYLAHLIASEQAAIRLAVARNEQLWDISLVGSASQMRSRSAIDVGVDARRNWEGYVGLQIDIPIGDPSRRQAELHSRVEVDNQEIRLAEARQTLEREVGDAVRGLGTRWRQYEIGLRARDLSRRKLEIEREKLHAGRSSNFQVLSFESDLRHAEGASLNALIAYLNAQAHLDKTLGTTLESWDIDLND